MLKEGNEEAAGRGTLGDVDRRLRGLLYWLLRPAICHRGAQVTCRQVVSTKVKGTATDHESTRAFKLEPREQVRLWQRGLGEEYSGSCGGYSKNKEGQQFAVNIT